MHLITHTIRVICREIERAEMAERAEWLRYQTGGKYLVREHSGGGKAKPHKQLHRITAEE